MLSKGRMDMGVISLDSPRTKLKALTSIRLKRNYSPIVLLRCGNWLLEDYRRHLLSLYPGSSVIQSGSVWSSPTRAAWTITKLQATEERHEISVHEGAECYVWSHFYIILVKFSKFFEGHNFVTFIYVMQNTNINM